jgi:cell wall-associated NlpC family hydrolase
MMQGVPGWVGAYVGVPFVERGYDFCGCHCWGLVWLVYRIEHGIDLARDDTVTASDIATFARAVDRSKALPPWQPVDGPRKTYDVVLMAAIERSNDRLYRRAAHVGIAVGSDRVLHVEKGADAVCVPVDDHSIRNRVLQSYRHEALTA